MEATGATQDVIGKRFGRTQGWVSKNLLGAGPTIDYLDPLGELTGHDPGDFVTARPMDFSQVPASTVPIPALADRWEHLSAADRHCVIELIDRLSGRSDRDGEFREGDQQDRRPGRDRRAG